MGNKRWKTNREFTRLPGLKVLENYTLDKGASKAVNRILEHKSYGLQGYRTFDPTVFYKQAQERKDLAWLKEAAKEVRERAKSDIIV